MSEYVKELSAESFSAHIATGVTLVYFWGETCGVCKLQVQEVNAAAERLAEQVPVGKVNVDAEADIARSEEIHFLPMVRFYRDGVKVRDLIGRKDAATLVAAATEV